MTYPSWNPPYLNSSWLLGSIFIAHILISHFTIGTALFFAVGESLHQERLSVVLKKYSLVFLLISTVAGALTGIGIWFSAQLLYPEFTARVVQQFGFAWVSEAMIFTAEFATLWVYYQGYDRLSASQRILLARLYALFALMTLAIINAILLAISPAGFELTVYIYTTILRLTEMLALAGFAAMIYVSFHDPSLRAYCAKWTLSLFGTALMLAFKPEAYGASILALLIALASLYDGMLSGHLCKTNGRESCKDSLLFLLTVFLIVYIELS